MKKNTGHCLKVGKLGAVIISGVLGAFCLPLTANDNFKSGNKKQYVLVDGLNVRAQASIKSGILGQLKKNQAIDIIDKQGGWYAINFPSSKDGVLDKAWVAAKHTSYIKPDYMELIRDDAVVPYGWTGREADIVRKHKKSLRAVNQKRLDAAYLALDSGKCDIVKNVEFLDTNNPQYLVHCENNEQIRLAEWKINQKSSGNIETESEKAIPREVAKNRCEDKIKKHFAKENKDVSIKIDPYSIYTWIYPDGQTLVNMLALKEAETKEDKALEYKAECRFHYNKSSQFEIAQTK